MRTVLAVVFVAFASVAIFAQPPKPPVRVYVWTAKVGIEERIAELTEKLDPKWLVASSKDTSEMQVEITSQEQTGTVYLDPVPSWGGRRPVPVLSLYATIRLRDSSTELVCTIGDKTPTWLREAHTPTWKDAAAICARKTKAWVKANREQLRPGETLKK